MVRRTARIIIILFILILTCSTYNGMYWARPHICTVSYFIIIICANSVYSFLYINYSGLYRKEKINRQTYSSNVAQAIN